MKNKWVIISFLSVAIFGSLGYYYYRRKKKPKNIKVNLNSEIENLPIEQTNVLDTKTIENKRPLINKNSQAVRITKKKLAQFKDTLSNYEYKNNSLYDKEKGVKIDEKLGWAVWGLLNRNYNSLYNGINNDKSINNDTKQYALNVLNVLLKTLQNVFPPQIFNTSSKLFTKYKLDTATEVNIYNEKV